MGKKYIIELEDGESVYKTITYNGYPMIQDVVPAPYTEPDLEQIRKEGYKDGYNAGLGRKIDASYQEGLSDAWEAARTLWNTPNRKEIFGYTTFNTVLTTLTAQKTIEKIRQYEQENQFRVGDEFETESGKRFVIIKMDGKEVDRYIDGDGTTYCMIAKYQVMRKTGRHFPEIVTVLEKMREESNG